jgi:hypothetical protein
MICYESFKEIVKETEALKKFLYGSFCQEKTH